MQRLGAESLVEAIDAFVAGHHDHGMVDTCAGRRRRVSKGHRFLLEARCGTCWRTPGSRRCWSTLGTSSRSQAASPTSTRSCWLAQLLEAGLLRGSFVPPPVMRQLRDKIPLLVRALHGRFQDHHARLLRRHLDHIDFLDAQITVLDDEVDQVIAPFAQSFVRQLEALGHTVHLNPAA